MSVDWQATGEGVAAFAGGVYVWLNGRRTKRIGQHAADTAEHTARVVENTSKVGNGFATDTQRKLDRILSNQETQGQQLAMLNERSEQQASTLDKQANAIGTAAADAKAAKDSMLEHVNEWHRLPRQRASNE